MPELILNWLVELVDNMAQQITNFGRFYSAFHKLKIHGEPEDAKKQFVSQYTSGRTESLKEMTWKEYNAMCVALEDMNGTRDELKRRRSIALKLMQELEVDTTDWAQINDFCRHPRISGKPFGQLSIDELMELATKLRSIKRKGWVRARHAKKDVDRSQHITYLINLASPAMTSYN